MMINPIWWKIAIKLEGTIGMVSCGLKNIDVSEKHLLVGKMPIVKRWSDDFKVGLRA